MRHFPVFLDLSDRLVLVLGSGPGARGKADLLRSAGARIRYATRFSPGLLSGCALAIGTGAPESDLEALSGAARLAGIPVNIVDRQSLCSFITPSIVDRDPITVAVSSAGTAPMLARDIRARIEQMLPPTIGRLAALLDSVKSQLRAVRPDLTARRRLIERWLNGAVAELAYAGRDAEARAHMARDLAGTPDPNGMVFLVGAGPGAADLATLRAQRLLGEADVVVHDRLVTADVLDLARRDAERIFVGKARANHCLRQEDINDLLIRLAREGKRVVRLKGGDPLVFGRGGEEAAALRDAGVPVEIVPGVTAALGCAAQAQIPITHRAVARTVTFVTGHTKDGIVDLDFEALTRLGGTLVVYMGAVSLPTIRTGLLTAGMAPGRPAALIERGGTTAQRVLHGTLGELARQADGWATGGPILLLLGEAVAEAPGRSAGGPAAVDRQGRAGHRGRLVGAEE